MGGMRGVLAEGGGKRVVDPVDLAVAAYREDGRWEVTPLPHDVAADLDALDGALRRLPAETGAIAMVSVGDDFFLLVRLAGRAHLVLSDASAADEWDLAAQALERIDPGADPAEVDEGPIGELGAFHDLGLSGLELALVCEDLDAYPDELLGQIATRLGFGEAFERVLDSSVAR